VIFRKGKIMILTELEQLNPLLRVFDVELAEGEMGADIILSGHLPNLYDELPNDQMALVYEIDTVERAPRQYQARVKYRHMVTTEPPLPRKEVISIQPGDVVVLTCKCDCTEKQAEAIRLEFKTLFPNNETVLLAGGATLEVYREQAKDV
jgi:hypothetical protein